MPDVWDGAEPDAAMDAEAPPDLESDPGELELVYGGIETRDEPVAGHRAGSVARDRTDAEAASASAVLIGHLVIPAAAIAMVSSLLFFFYDLRSVYLPGSNQLKWVGFCFVFAAVLIARYGRMAGGAIPPSLYSGGLVVATVVTMSISPWEAPEVGLLGPITNLLIIAVIWRFSRRLTISLSGDLDPHDEPERRLFGLERLEMERLKKSHAAGPVSVYELGRRRRRAERKKSGDPEQAIRSVIALILVGLLLFALGEPILLAGHPAAAQHALGAMILFLLSSALLLSAASSMRNISRLRALGTKASLAGIGGRLMATAVFMVVLLAVTLTTPGLSFTGSGQIIALEAEGPGVEGGDDRGSAEDSPSEDVTRDTEAQRSQDFQENQAQGGETEAASGSQAQSASAVVQTMGSLGSYLRWPVLFLAALLILFAIWRLTPTLLALWKDGKLGAMFSSLLDGLRRLLANLLPTFKSRSGSAGAKGSRAKIGVSFEGLEGLAQLAPQEAVLNAYGRMLNAWALAGFEPAENLTPTEKVASLPGSLKGMREPCGKLTEIYLRSAFGDQPTPASDRQQVIVQLQQLRTWMGSRES